jgi:L-ascorbate metabolism protein UlaG (beta-lactamase superfamily)
MANADVSSWGHACVRFEKDGHILVIDPGTLSDLAVLEGADAVLITHEHPDHVAAPAVAAAMTGGELEVWAPEVVVGQLIAAGAPAERVHAASEGQAFAAAGFEVSVHGHQHAIIHPAIPPVANVAYLVDGVALHPGDSFTPAPEGTRLEVLFLPVSAPWLKLAEAIDYLGAASPRTVVPIHDGFLNDVGRALVDRVTGSLAGSAEYRRLAPGDSVSLGRSGPG